MSGAWSQQNLLALGGEDNIITISNAEGDTLRQSSVRSSPVDIQFSEMKSDERSNLGENTVCIFFILQLYLICNDYTFNIDD